VRKKTEKEEKEDEELAKAVNRTLAEEEKKKEEDERRKRDEKKKTTDKVKDQDEKKKTELDSGSGNGKTEDEASGECLPCSPCEECRQCPEYRPCVPCPPVVDNSCPEETPCLPCRPCSPCPVVNHTTIVHDCPPPPSCIEAGGMSVSVAVAVGASAGVLITGATVIIGLILRYVPPIVSGFIFVATIVIIWYLCSHYPETARELGGRAVAILREASVALGHRIMAALQRHPEQVSVLAKPNLFSRIFRMSSIFIFH
jgi:hypothetical protein